MAQPGADSRFSEHYKRLQVIEQRVVAAVQLAAKVVGEMAKAGGASTEEITQHAAGFMQAVQDAQQQLLAAVKGAVSERSFEATVYHQMAGAAVTMEQLAAVDTHLAGLQRLLARGRARAAAAAAAGGGGGSGGGVIGDLAGVGDDVDELMLDAPPETLTQEA